MEIFRAGKYDHQAINEHVHYQIPRDHHKGCAENVTSVLQISKTAPPRTIVSDAAT